METLASIGLRIAEARKERQMRQVDLAAASTLSRATIDALEHGRTNDIGVSKLSRILAVLGLEINIRPSGGRPTLDELLKADLDD